MRRLSKACSTLPKECDHVQAVPLEFQGLLDLANSIIPYQMLPDHSHPVARNTAFAPIAR